MVIKRRAQVSETLTPHFGRRSSTKSSPEASRANQPFCAKAYSLTTGRRRRRMHRDLRDQVGGRMR
jgi:hypothetical protein